MEKIDIAIIGAGVVGLAVAESLSKLTDNIFVFERHKAFGQETSSRNSEVIHSGIYYPKNSLKAKLCVDGRPKLYEFCEKNHVPFRKLTKLIVAADETEIEELNKLHKFGLDNGVEGMELIDKSEINKIETECCGYAAILSKETGIIDSHSLMKKLESNAESRGACIVYNMNVNSIEYLNNEYIIGFDNNEDKISARIVVNCAGLQSDKIAELAGINVDADNCRLKYVKGSYFFYSAPSPVKRLIYPLPETNHVGLGVHATLDMNYRLKFGPDTEAVDEVEYSVDISKSSIFHEKALKIIRGLEAQYFMPNMAGVRPKLKGAGVRDFVIRSEEKNGNPGLISLIGIESPGLTSCLAIADYVKKIISDLDILK